MGGAASASLGGAFVLTGVPARQARTAPRCLLSGRLVHEALSRVSAIGSPKRFSGCPIKGGSVADSERADIAWRKSTVSGTGDCVEVAFTETVLVRHSRDPHGPMLSFSYSEWTAFMAGAGLGEFDAERADLPDCSVAA